MNNKDLLNEIITFIQSDNDILCDHVSDDLEINIDYECSEIYDQVDKKFLSRSFAEIVEKTRDRIVVAIESYIDEDLTTEEDK
jgi:hypothetical protein